MPQDDSIANSPHGPPASPRSRRGPPRHSLAPRLRSVTAPIATVGLAAYSNPQDLVHNPSGTPYGAFQPISVVSNEPSVLFHDMAGKNDHTFQHNHQHMIPPQSIGPTPLALLPQPHPFGSYPVAEYSPYYSVPPAHDSFLDYSYQYDTYRGLLNLRCTGLPVSVVRPLPIFRSDCAK